MKSRAATSLGIDIVASEINAVLLRRNQAGFRVLGAIRVPLPEGTIGGGRIVDSAALLKALRSVKECRRRQSRTEVSLPPDATLVRVMPLIEEDPRAILRFVQEEIVQYAAFSGRRTVSDYRVVAAARKNVPGKIAIAAVDRGAVEAVVCACRSMGIEPRTAEPAIMGSVRAFRASKSYQKLGHNVVLALLKGGVLTLAVLRKGTLEFTRTRDLGPVDGDSLERYDRAADEINAIVQFYAVQGTAIPSVVLIDDESDVVPVEAEKAVRSKIVAENVEVWMRGNLSDFVPLEPGIDGKGSIVAVGLAMRSLMEEESTELNLLPREVDRATVVQRHVIGAAIALAALLLVVILVTGGMRWMAGRMHHRIAVMDQAGLQRGHYSLPMAVEELIAIEERIAVTSHELNCLAQAARSRLDVDWVQLLNDVRAAVPMRMRLTELSVEGTSIMRMEGVSESHEAIAALVAALNRSELIAQTGLLQAGPHDGENGAIRYTLECTLTPEEIR